MKKTIICIYIFVVISGCYRDYNLKSVKFINNNSNVSVFFTRSNAFPDTSLSDIGFCCSDKLNPKTSCVSNLLDGWEDEFKRNENKMLMIFVLDAQVVETVPWDTVEKQYPVLKRYDLTMEDMDSLNWTITYP
jgi:hypothetical protein